MHTEYSKKIRLLELIIVLSVAVLPGFFNSLFMYFNLFSYRGFVGSFDSVFFTDILRKLSSIAILIYILYKQGRSIKDIGFTFSWRDIYRALYIIFISVILSVAYYYICNNIYLTITGKHLITVPRNLDVFKSKITVIYFLAMLVNPFFEELIARAYLISEIEYLTKSKFIAVVVSVVVQTSYHLYQGVYAMGSIAVMFLVLSIYYVRSKRIAPTIIVHAINNILSMFNYGKL